MIYAMWTTGDEKPFELPKGCEYRSNCGRRWEKEHDAPESWGQCERRWPVEQPEQRPTAFGLLSEEEQEELEEAHKLGNLEFVQRDATWKHKNTDGPLIGNSTYRIKQEPQEPEITVTVNGELIDFRELVRQEVARIYEVQDFTNGVPVGGYPGN